MHHALFESALGIASPGHVQGVELDEQARTLSIHIDFALGSRFSHPQAAAENPVHEMMLKRLRHLNFFQHECFLLVRAPRVKLPEGRVVLVVPRHCPRPRGPRPNAAHRAEA